MKVVLEIESCSECPYYEYVPDNSSSNDDGYPYCKKLKRGIKFFRFGIPDECPIRPVEKKWNYQKDEK